MGFSVDSVGFLWGSVGHLPFWCSVWECGGTFTQEADRPDRSTSMPKVVVGGPQVLKVFSWIFIYIFHKNMVLGPKKSVKPG